MEAVGEKEKVKVWDLCASEHLEQCALVQWKWLNIGRHPELANLFAIANGGRRDGATGARLKAEGVLAGVPDLFLACPRGAYAGLFVEMKVKPNRPTEKQLEVMENLRRQNYAVLVCYGWEQARDAILEYLRGKSWDSRELLEWVAQKHATAKTEGEKEC